MVRMVTSENASELMVLVNGTSENGTSENDTSENGTR